MALRNQPYIPLYVDDYLTDEKLNLCSAATQGVYIKILCIMHKSEPYGCVLLKQKDKQNESTCLNFAYKLARLLPFTTDEINDAIIDLIDEKVLYFDGDMMCQKRMIKDNSISISRSKAGSKGGKSTQSKRESFALAKSEANSVSVIVNENVVDNIVNESFEKFWNAYGKKVDRVKCEREWSSIDNPEYQKIVDHVPKYVEATPDPKYRKNPINYLKDRTWQDEDLPIVKSQKPKRS